MIALSNVKTKVKEPIPVELWLIEYSKRQYLIIARNDYTALIYDVCHSWLHLTRLIYVESHKLIMEQFKDMAERIPIEDFIKIIENENENLIAKIKIDQDFFDLIVFANVSLLHSYHKLIKRYNDQISNYIINKLREFSIRPRNECQIV